MPKYTIREFRTFKEMSARHSLLIQLSPNVTKMEYDRMLEEMLKNGYRMIGVFDPGKEVRGEEKCIGISGFWISTKFYCGKYLEPDNVVIDRAYRSKGIGKLILNWLAREAKKQKCSSIILDAYVENFAAHHFYHREGFIARGFHYLKKL